ncbi:MAG: family 1 glycosylhydrolase [Verrucomicrobiota bacterium]
MTTPSDSDTEKDRAYKPGFLLGVATSGYQCEGGFNGPGEPRNNWAAHEIAGKVARTGVATDFWNRYREDFELCRGMGLNAFRLSIEWARVQPGNLQETGPAPDFDLAAIDGYADRIAACREAGLEPVVTLHHFTHPAWLGVDAWLNDSTPELFGNFVSRTLERLNERLCGRLGQKPVEWYVTINEPNMLVLNTYMNHHFPGGPQSGISVGVRAYNRLLAAHVRAYNAIHDLYESRGWSSPQVTMNTFCSDVYWSEQILLDLLCLREHGIPPGSLPVYFAARAGTMRESLLQAYLPLRADPLAWAGRAVQGIANFFASRAATTGAFSFFLAEAARSKRDCVLDYLGLDYYDPFLSHIFRIPSFSDLEFPSGSLHGYLMDGLSSKWWDWHILPEGLRAFCSHYSRAFPGKGILIAENGMAQRVKSDNRPGANRKDRITRSEFLTVHFAEVRRMLAEKLPLLGYLHWSLTDNYEWGSFTPRFGLYRIDYANGLRRIAVDHLGDNPSQTYARLIRDFRQQPLA